MSTEILVEACDLPPNDKIKVRRGWETVSHVVNIDGDFVAVAFFLSPAGRKRRPSGFRAGQHITVVREAKP